MITINIIVRLGSIPLNGTEVTFRAPADASRITGLKIMYPHNGSDKEMVFNFADAHGINVGNIDHLFADRAVVKVILDTDREPKRAFIQNSDTNTYLERRLKDIDDFVEKFKGSIASVQLIEWEEQD